MNRSKFSVVFLPILIIGLIFILLRREKNSDAVLVRLEDKHRGVCWVAGPIEIDSNSFSLLKSYNVNWISQTPFGWQNGYDNPQIGTNRDIEARGGRVFWGERDQGIRATTMASRKLGIKTILKPHIWLRDKNGKWRGDIAMKSEDDWELWFEEYTDFILHYAKLAEELEIEMLCIGTELHQTALRETNWRSVIAEIRQVYSGQLTYAANFSAEYKDIQFWDELDFIGVQAYFPLVKKEEPSLEEIQEGWQKPIKELRAFSNQYKKPILFTEVGYKSTKDAGIEPWKWPERTELEQRKSIYSAETQAKLYQALFKEVWDQPWLAGFHFWKWYPGSGGNFHTSAPNFNIGFTPQNKKAEQIMGSWFKKLAR